jgi:transposase
VHLSDFDLQQLDEARLSQLTVSQQEVLLKKVVADLKEARERLKADSRTSSRPPSSDVPWLSAAEEDIAEVPEEPPLVDAAEPALEEEAEASPEPVAEEAFPADPAREPKRPGRPKGHPGHSRQLTLAVDETITHAPEYCALCGRGLADQPFKACTGLYVLDLEPTEPGELRGLQARHDKHLYGERVCPCGHGTRTEPGRSEAELGWTVELSEWHLIGPRLVGHLPCLSPLIAAPSMRNGLARDGS